MLKQVQHDSGFSVGWNERKWVKPVRATANCEVTKIATAIYTSNEAVRTRIIQDSCFALEKIYKISYNINNRWLLVLLIFNAFLVLQN